MSLGNIPLPFNRLTLTPQRPPQALLRQHRLTRGKIPAGRRQAGHALMRTSVTASGRAALPNRTQAAAWRTRMGMLSTLGKRLKRVLWYSLGIEPPQRTLERTLERLRQQRQTLAAELAQAKTDLSQLRAELAGTQAGERTAKHQAMHDGLTGQPNRRLFMDALHRAMRRPGKGPDHTSVMFLDIDGFKRINDQHGHKVGDRVLKTVGARLAKSVREGDMVARLGGDEFACLLQGALTRPQLLTLAHKLHEAMAAPMKLGNLTLHVQVSIGLACAPQDGQTADALLDQADAAMYQAKQQHTEVMCASDKAADPAATDHCTTEATRSTR